MRVLFLHSGDRVPSARFRALPFARRLREHGHQAVLAGSFPQKYDHFPTIGFRPSQLLKRLVRAGHLLQATVRRFDVIVLDRELFDGESFWWEDQFRRVARSLALDVDDGIFLRYPDKYRHLAKISDCVLAGNAAIARFTRPLNEQVTVIPTCIDLQEYQMPAEKDMGTAVPIVGWMGTTGNLPFLEVCAPALRELAGEVRFRLRLIAGESTPLQKVNLSGVDVQFVPWDGGTEVEELSRFDVGLMPLPDGQPWMEYKCGLKLLQYMALGIPGVASPIGVNSEIVQSGRNGYLASNQDEWREALRRLLTDPAHRRELGSRARTSVENGYSLDVHYPRFVSALEAAIERSRQVRKSKVL